MAEFIDRDALLHVIGEMPLDWEYGQAVSEIYEIVKNAPTINPGDLRPKGRWKEIEWGMFFECSCCGSVTDYHLTKFCPDCGARMEK